MSVTIASGKTTAKIADMIYGIVKWGREQERCTLSADSIDYIKSIWGNVDSERELRIFEALQKLNFNSFQTRYHDSIKDGTITLPEAEPYSRHRFKRSEGFHLGENGPEDYQKLKSIMFFRYQCIDHNNSSGASKLLGVLSELKQGLFHYIIDNTPEFKDAIWG